MLGAMTAETIQLARQQLFGAGMNAPGMFGKAGTQAGFNTSLGVVWYDLEATLKRLYQAHAPLRNEIPRVGLTGVGFGLAANWRALINLNNSQVFSGVSEGKRGGQIQYTEKDLSATYKGLGLESFVNFEAEYAAQGFDDILDTATTTLLQTVMVGEEQMVLWGNTSLALGTTPTPTLVTTTTGTFASGTAYVFCVALTPWGQLLAGGAVAPTTASIVATNNVIDQTARTNADGSSDTINGGHAIVSAQASIAVNGTQGVRATLPTAVPGAAAYAWYVGASAGAANAALAAITTIPTATFTASGNAANQKANFTGAGSDRSTNALAFDGLTTQLLAASGWGTGGIYTQLSQLTPASGGAYSLSLAGQPLTGSAGKIDQIDAMLAWMWNAYKLYPDEIWVSGYQAAQITNIAMASSAPSYRINVAMQPSGPGSLAEVVAGSLVTSYLNKYALGGATKLPIRVHPYMPDSWIFANVKSITDKYPIANVTVPNRIKARREYYSVAWPVTTRQRQYGVYVDEVLECYVPFAMGLLYDVG